MKYKILRGILIAGVVLGFGSGFAQVGARWAMHRDGHHPYWGQHCRDKDRDQATPEVKNDTRSGVKPQPTPEAKIGAKPAATPEAKIDAKPQPTIDAKPQATIGAKPQPTIAPTAARPVPMSAPAAHAVL